MSMLSSTYCWARQCGDGFKNRRANFPGRAWTTTTRGVANLARSGHNRGSTKLPTPSPSLARRRPHRGFLMGTLGRAQAKKCHTYCAHHSRHPEGRRCWEHLLGKCPAWSQERWKTFLSHRELIKADPVDIVAFLRQTGRLPANDSA